MSRNAETTSAADRRAFLGSSLALASALTAAAVPAPADAAPAIGPIEAAWPEHVALSQAADATVFALDDAEERYQEPPRPLWFPATCEGGYKMTRQRGDIVVRPYLSTSDTNLDWLRDVAEKPFRQGAPVPLGYELHRAKKARDTLDRIEAWQAECRVCAEAAGLPEAQAAEEKARLALLDHAEAMFAMEPASYRDMAFLAALVDMHWISGWAETLVERMMSFAGITRYWQADQASAAEGHANVA